MQPQYGDVITEVNTENQERRSIRSVVTLSSLASLSSLTPLQSLKGSGGGKHRQKQKAEDAIVASFVRERGGKDKVGVLLTACASRDAPKFYSGMLCVLYPTPKRASKQPSVSDITMLAVHREENLEVAPAEFMLTRALLTDDVRAGQSFPFWVECLRGAALPCGFLCLASCLGWLLDLGRKHNSHVALQALDNSFLDNPVPPPLPFNRINCWEALTAS